MKRIRHDVCLEAIGILCDEAPTGVATNGMLARRLGLSTGTVSSLLKRLAAEGLVIHTPYEGVQLTSSGLRRSRRLIRRRRLLQQFLHETLRLPHAVAIDESVDLQMAASDRLIALIATTLRQPEWTTAGEPIPTEEGGLPAFLRLVDCSHDEIVRLQRIEGESGPATFGGVFLHLGVEIGVLVNDAGTGTIVVRIDGMQLTLGHSIAHRILVQRIAASEDAQDGSTNP